jgi:cytidine deaminase
VRSGHKRAELLMDQSGIAAPTLAPGAGPEIARMRRHRIKTQMPAPGRAICGIRFYLSLCTDMAKQPHPSPDAALLAKAEQAAKRAYAPYSRFRVGCAIRTASGKIHSGCNVENESYPAGICAERSALAAAVAAEGPTPTIEQIVIYALGSDGKQVPCSPCGVCCQVLGEIASQASVGFLAADGYKELTTSQLLPYSFHGQLK